MAKSKSLSVVPATPAQITDVLARQNYTFTPAQIASKSFLITRKNGKTNIARIYKSQVDTLINMMKAVAGHTPSVEHQRLVAALNSMSLSSRRGREKLTKEKLKLETPRSYTVSKTGKVSVPVAAWFGFDAEDGVKRKIAAHYRDDGVLISYK